LPLLLAPFFAPSSDSLVFFFGCFRRAFRILKHYHKIL
jgi:hypothetical protein